MRGAEVNVRRPLWVLAGVMLFALGLAAPALALAFAPALVLLALLAAGVHPGEALIARLHARRDRRCPRAASTPRPRLALVLRRAGRLIASAPGTRAPPGARAAVR